MMAKIYSWLRKNWQFLVIVGLAVLLLQKQSPVFRSLTSSRYDGFGVAQKTISPSFMAEEMAIGRGGVFQEAPPAPEVEDRLVIRNSQMSLLVKNVREVQKAIIAKAENLGGYMVNSRIDSPYGIDSSTVTVRIPEPKLNEVLEYFRALGVRVVSENLVGRDVTDEYVDIEARLAILRKTKVKFEEILEKAEKIQDILQVQREIINLQSQIDNLKGRQKYLEKSAQTSKVTVYLSTDELALPYAPSQPWRPKVIFKQATRSLIKTFRSAGALGIWLGVYAIVWLPLLLIIWLIKKKVKRVS